MNVKPIIVGAVAWIAIRAAQKLQAVQRFTYSLLGLPHIRVSGSFAVLTVNISITNATSERFNIQKVFGAVKINGLQVGTLQSSDPVSINGYSTAPIAISLTTELTNTIVSLISALATNSGGILLTVSGSVVTDTVTVPMVVSKRF